MKDLSILRNLAGEYASLALTDENLAIPERYRNLNSLDHTVRPPVLVFAELPDYFRNVIEKLEKMG